MASKTESAELCESQSSAPSLLKEPTRILLMMTRFEMIILLIMKIILKLTKLFHPSLITQASKQIP